MKKEVYTKDSSHVWDIPCYAAFPCATQNELCEVGVQALLANDVKVVAEGANMPSTPEAIELLQKNKVLFAPAKAANAGGVAVSVLEMSQNNSLHYLPFEVIDARLQEIMSGIYRDIKEVCDEHALDMDLLAGANILGFQRVADAMIMQGV
jgi:glutamate dehydrogenase (NADP+)